MSTQEFRRQTVGDAKFWIGVIAFALGIGANLLTAGRVLQRVDDLKTDMEAIKSLPPRVAVTEARIDGLNTRVQLIESHYGVGSASAQPLYRTQPQ